MPSSGDFDLTRIFPSAPPNPKTAEELKTALEQNEQLVRAVDEHNETLESIRSSVVRPRGLKEPQKLYPMQFMRVEEKVLMFSDKDFVATQDPESGVFYMVRKDWLAEEAHRIRSKMVGCSAEELRLMVLARLRKMMS